MNVALVTQRFTRGDGQGRVNLEIAARALQKGHRVFLVSAECDAALRVHPNAEWVSVSVAGWPTDLGRNLAFAAQATRWLRRNRSRLDLVHVNGGNVWLAGDVNSAHFVHSAWQRSPARERRLSLRGMYQTLHTAFNARWEMGAFRSARAVVAVSGMVREELLAIGIDAGCVCVIPNGVDLQEFHPGPADRAALNLPDGPPLGLLIGDLRTARKNLDTVLRAMTEVKDMHLAVAGGTDGSPYPAMAGALGLTERVHFLGFRHDTPALLRAADFCLCPSRYEPFSLVLLEAMASGCPVITARSVGAAPLAGAGGILLDNANDVVMLARSMQMLSADAARRDEMGRAGRALAEQHGWAQMADRYLMLYEEVGAERSRNRSAEPMSPSDV